MRDGESQRRFVAGQNHTASGEENRGKVVKLGVISKVQTLYTYADGMILDGSRELDTENGSLLPVPAI